MNLRGSVSVCSEQGPRLHQEDRHLVQPVEGEGRRGYLLAVLDGHGGSAAADLCVGVLPGLLAEAGGEKAEETLRRIVGDLDRRTRGMGPGTTVSLAYVVESDRRVTVATVGDSPVIVCDAEGAVWVSRSHNVRVNPEERHAAERRGGEYDGFGYVRNPSTGYGLQMSRALGDAAMGSVLGREPELHSCSLGPESFVILATDGVADPAHREADRVVGEIVSLARRTVPFDASTLLRWAGARGLQDNATAVVWASAETER